MVSWWKRNKEDYISNSTKTDPEKIKYLLSPGSIIGSFSKLNGAIWETSNIIALEQVQLITFSMKDLDNIMRVF